MFDLRSAPRPWLGVTAALCLLVAVFAPDASAQTPPYDPSWYDANAPHVKIDVVEDGVYRVTGSALQSALPSGTSLSGIDPSTLRLIENGTEIPIHVEGSGDGSFDASDALQFVGRRNRGTDEMWAYDEPSDPDDPPNQSSDFYSLYADTTTYWLTWGGAAGQRYTAPSPPASASSVSALSDLAHIEEDNTYYYGRSRESGDSYYTQSEGYYWTEFRLTDVGTTANTYTLPVARRTASSAEELQLTVRLDASSSSCHRVEIEADLTQSSGTAFEQVASREWDGTKRQTLQATIPQDRIPGDLRVRVRSRNDSFTGSDCPDPASNPNFVLLDYLEASYVRRLAARNGTQRFVAPQSTAYAFNLSGYTAGASVLVFNEADARRYSVTASGGTAVVADEPTAPNTAYWAVERSALKTPAAIEPDTPSNWSVASAQGADYVILTTDALRPSAERLAAYRRAQNGYSVSVVTVQNVFDEFDYGRPTPLAIRRFTHAMQDWSPSPQFLTIFADAAFPVDPAPRSPRPTWSVPSFGYSPSDGWYAMQTDGEGDLSEYLAIGRVPVRTNAQGDLFLDKLRTYEASDPAPWTKRMLLLAGGVTTGEQSNLQFYSNRWGELATGTSDSLYAAGMDTLRYYKRVGDALDTSFQDSLAVDLERGAGWLSYFGHSAAQTWEIVTDPPEEFGNAGRLPIVLSLGCKTGSFAGDRFSLRGTPSLGEQFVVGSLASDGTPIPGSENGGIAHWGTSALGNLTPSARLGDALTRRVFRDTMRVLGSAVRAAKAEIAENQGSTPSSIYQRHLLTYGLLGDPATRIAIADRPDLQVSEQQIQITPIAPVPSEPLSVRVRVQNVGLVPRDSVDYRLTWTRPDGSSETRTTTVPRFAQQSTTDYAFDLDERALGTNVFRASVDPDNEYAEARETNNRAERTQVVFDSGVDLIRPAQQDVVSSRRPTLRASVLRSSSDSVPIVVQLDTVPDFSSSARRDARLTASSVAVAWTPDAPLQDGQTYYWRARLDTPDAASSWDASSFSVQTTFDGSGWLQQGRFFQANDQTRLSHQQPTWSFTPFDVSVKTYSERGSGSSTYGFVVGGTQRYLRLAFGFGVLVVDGLNGRVKDAQTFPTYDLDDQYLEENGDQQEAIDSLRAFLDRTVRDGDYVFVGTRHLARESGPTIQDEVKTLFRNLGSDPAPEPYTTAIDTLRYTDLWILKARYGSPEATREQVSDATNEIIQEDSPSFRHASGETLTPLIGPVSAWKTLRWTTGATGSGDRLRIDVLARDSTVLVRDLSGLDGTYDLRSIDASAHPYLRLRATLTDSTARTAPNLERWSVGFTGVPELIVDPVGLQAIADTLQEGASPSYDVTVANLGPVASAPVYLRSDLVTASNAQVPLRTDTLDALAPLAETSLSASIASTADRTGTNLLRVAAETNGPPERIGYNNTALRSFFVRADDTPPSLEVLSEGRELPPTPASISDLQDPRLPFVPASPTLEIQVRDDNPFLRLTDTSYVEVYLKEGLPSDNPQVVSEYRQIPFAGPTLSFSPPEGDDNRARVLYEPRLPPEDNTYSLKVEAQDAQGNEVDPYQVSFRVQQEQVIEDLYPYPNPMSDHTRFAFRIRGGNTRPSDFTLRIYTLSGRLVREFDGAQANGGQGLRTAGWNFLTWDGTDADGDRVATGVYLYRVRMEGEDGTFEGDVEKIAVIR